MAILTLGIETLDDLARTEEKAELVAGRIVYLMSTGRIPNRVAGGIFMSLYQHAKQTGIGEAYTDNMDFALKKMLTNGRQSFSPDASYYVGPFPANPMSFILGPPTFAVEVRSENDYGESAEEEMADKRADYFEAGTLVVWDVDPIAKSVSAYSASDPTNPTTYRSGDMAEATPAVSGWSMAVADIFG